MSIDRIQPDGLTKPTAYTQVVKSGNTVHIAGQTSISADGQIMGAGDINVQAEQVFSNLEVALASVGATWANVVKITVPNAPRGYRRLPCRAGAPYPK